jgi:hypothetical protein
MQKIVEFGAENFLLPELICCGFAIEFRRAIASLSVQNTNLTSEFTGCKGKNCKNIEILRKGFAKFR